MDKAKTQNGIQRFDLPSRREFLKRSALLILGAAGGSGLLAACSSGASAPAATQAPAAKPAATQAPAATTAPVATAAAAKPASQIKRGGTLRDVQLLAIDSLDPHLASTRNVSFMPLLYDNLLTYLPTDPQRTKWAVKPGLAESYKVVDALTVEFKLRKGVKFHDGSAFNAAVAKWNLERAAGHAKSGVKETVRDIDKIETPDEYTLVLKLKNPASVLPMQMTSANPVMVAMVSKEAVERLGEAKFATNPVGSGPFKFKEWVRDDRVVLEKFPGHWETGEDGQPLPYFDTFVSRLIADQSAALLEIKSGNMDSLANPELKDIAGVKADPNLKAENMPLGWYAYPALYFNPRPDATSPFSKNPKLREAAHYAIDRDSMAKALGFGMAVPQYYQYFYPGMPGYDETLPRREFNLEKAKQLMAEAGFANGVDIEVKVINRTIDRRPVEMLQAMWEKVGIRMKINAMDRLVWIDDGRAGRFEALTHSNGARPDPMLAQDSRTGSTYNWPGYSRKEVDELWARAGTEYDTEKRAQIYKDIQKRLYEDAYHVTGYMYPQMAALNKKVMNYSTLYNYRYIWLA